MTLTEEKAALTSATATTLASVSTAGTAAGITVGQSGGGALMATSVTTTDGAITHIEPEQIQNRIPGRSLNLEPPRVGRLELQFTLAAAAQSADNQSVPADDCREDAVGSCAARIKSLMLEPARRVTPREPVSTARVTAKSKAWTACVPTISPSTAVANGRNHLAGVKSARAFQ